MSQSTTLSSPRSRGWSLAAWRTTTAVYVVPALAGVVPAGAGPGCPPMRRPRARGGGPPSVSANTGPLRSSPRSRGWSAVPGPVAEGLAVVPALAGVVPGADRQGGAGSRRPRARGGGPASGCPPTPAAGSSPRSRGWSVPRRDHGRPARVVPALAGVVPRDTPSTRIEAGRPRARGGGPAFAISTSENCRSSPRSRGWSRPGAVVPAITQVVPPQQGVEPDCKGQPRTSTGRPRARGGGPGLSGAAQTRLMSSPRSRGWSRDRLRQREPVAVVPALAGVVRGSAAALTTCGRRPRARGGGPLLISRSMSAARSSPRSRGWSPADMPPGGIARVVPALAGVVPRRSRAGTR